MSVLDSARILIFRCHQKGLEVLMIDNHLPKESNIWKESKAEMDLHKIKGLIELEEQEDGDGTAFKPVAIEADWYQIPSIRALLKHDIKRLGKKVKTKIGQDQALDFVDIKAVLKTALPHEYKALKELKDIVMDRNQMQSI